MSKVIKLGNYKGIEFKVEKVPVSNEEVEQQIQMILAQSSQTEEKDGDTVENGDIATIDFVGLKDDVAFEGGTGNDYDLEIGSGSFIPGFEEQMIGMKVNETRDLNLTFPENYQAEDLAGQDVVFKVTVKKLSVKKAAELNDDFVEGLGVPEIKTVEDLKAYINEGLQQQHDQQYEAQKENTIFDAFMADSEVELDDDAIDEALDRQMSYMANQMMAQGIQLDQYLQMTGMDEEKLREQILLIVLIHLLIGISQIILVFQPIHLSKIFSTMAAKICIVYIFKSASSTLHLFVPAFYPIPSTLHYCRSCPSRSIIVTFFVSGSTLTVQ